MLSRTPRNLGSSFRPYALPPVAQAGSIALAPRPLTASPLDSGASSLSSREAHPYPQTCQLEIDRQTGADGLTLTVRGEIDLGSAPALERELRHAESRARRIVLDLAGLEFIDSAGIHALIGAQERAAIHGHELVLTHVPAHARRLFTLIGISSLFRIE